MWRRRRADMSSGDPGARRRRELIVVLVIAAGGVLGAESRHVLDLALPHAANGFPWSTLVVNVSGCLLIGILMVVLTGLTSPHRLVRPFLGVGVLGGYTTFSTMAVDIERLVLLDRLAIAGAYLLATVLTCAIAVWLATMTTQLVLGRVHARQARRPASVLAGDRDD